MNDKVFFLRFIFTVSLFYIFSTIGLQTSFAQNYTQMSLPEGAKARLGKGIIKDILYSPDGSMFVVVSSIGHWLYDTRNYQEIDLLPIPKSRERAISHRIQNTNFSVDGNKLISETEEKWVIIWDVTTKESKEISLENDTSFSTDRKTLTIGTGQEPIELWHGKKVIIENPDKKYDAIDTINAHSPDGQTNATTEDEYTIRISDARNQNLNKIRIEFIRFDYGQRIILSPDGKTLATLYKDAPIRLWDSNTGRLMGTLVGHLVKNNPKMIQTRFQPSPQLDSLAFSPDGKTLANGSLDGTIRLWNRISGKLIRELRDQFGFVKSLSFSSDGKFLASGSDDGSIIVWDLHMGKPEPYIAERMNSISCVAFSHNGRMLLGGSVNGDIFMFDVETKNLIKTFKGHIAEISHVIFSTDDRKIASIGWDGSIRLWDVETGNLIKTLSVPIPVHSDDNWKGMLFLNNGDLIAIKDEFDFIHLWNVNTGDYIRMLIGHAVHLRSLSVSADSKTLASHSGDGTILLWDLHSIIKTMD